MDGRDAGMRVIGLTGGIASGKTAVSDRLAARGAAIVDTDLLAREVVMRGTPGLAAVVEAFGPGILTPDGTLDRKALGELVFTDGTARARLNAITHPRIREAMVARLGALREASPPPPAAVLVVPLLFENGLDAMVEESWVVDVPEDVQRARLIAREGFTPAEADARIGSQMARGDKLRRATRVISNAGDLAALEAEITRVWREAGFPG
jgi:dephospho-CoA kinase